MGVGFLVWNPSRNLPTVSHDTLERALSEAERLTKANPGERFVIMSPVLTADAAISGKAFSAGARWMQHRAYTAEENARRRIDEAIECEAKVGRRFEAFEKNQRQFQAIVADCLLWFDGFRAAHAGQPEWGRPQIPNREDMRNLNAALQSLEVTPQPEFEEVPF